MLNQGVPQVFMLTHYSTAFGCGVRQRKVLKYCTSGLFFILLHKKSGAYGTRTRDPMRDRHVF